MCYDRRGVCRNGRIFQTRDQKGKNHAGNGKDEQTQRWETFCHRELILTDQRQPDAGNE
jgi:hypothetical protein